MVKYLIVLPDGTEIYSGSGATNAIASVNITALTNSETELTLGSVCSSILEVSIITPYAALSIAAGADVGLYQIDDTSGTRTKVGVYTAEKPTRPSANRLKLTAYDHVSWLDVDLSEWLTNLTGWPYRIDALAQMVCAECGVALATATFPNGDFQTNRPSVSDGITGRQLIRWIAEIAGRFCVANADGELEFRWYEASDVLIEPTGDNYYLSETLSYEDYEVAQVDAVKVRLADSDSGALWPEGDCENPYIIQGNRLLNSNISDGTVAVLETIMETVGQAKYTPCKVTVPISTGIRVGQIVDIKDSNSDTITTYVMQAVYSGQTVTIESTGSAQRNSSEAMNTMSSQDMKNYADSAASGAVASQTQVDIFNKLTGGGKAQGIYLKDGILYINAEYIGAGFISSDIIRAGKIRSADFQVADLEFLYPAEGLYPSDGLYPNNGEEIIQGIEIDFASGIIRGVFFNSVTDTLRQEVDEMKSTISKLEARLAALEQA